MEAITALQREERNLDEERDMLGRERRKLEERLGKIWQREQELVRQRDEVRAAIGVLCNHVEPEAGL